jgi:hypothetical protein
MYEDKIYPILDSPDVSGAIVVTLGLFLEVHVLQHPAHT